MPGDFNDIRNHKLFEQVLVRQQRLAEMDPKKAFASLAPGFLGALSESMGPWRGREEVRFEVPGAAEDANAVAPHERARLGSTDMFHVVAEPGMLLAGKTQWVSPDDFRYGMTAEKAAERAGRPLVDFNQKTSKVVMDVITQGAFSDGSDDFSDAFAWSATDLNGTAVTHTLATENANQVADVIAHSGQAVEWPLRDGSVAAAGHDHMLEAQGASWTETLADTARDTILEHPGAGRVAAIVGANVAADVRAQLKTEYGAVESRVPFIKEGFVRDDGFGATDSLGRIGSVDYIYAPDVPDDIAIYYASNQKPFYHSVGDAAAQSVGGSDGLGGWSETMDVERGGLKYGYRNYFTAGCKLPTMVALAEYTA